MPLIDLISLLSRPGSTVVDLYTEEDDFCLWTGAAGSVPAELLGRTVGSFDVSSAGLNITLI